ncbi:MAG: hypothetical protein WCF19_08005 [Chlamydiales bacterium]
MGVPSKNFDVILCLPKNFKKEDVITNVASVCLQEIEKSQLGWGHSVRKFLASSLTYASLLALPIATLMGALWFYLDKIKELSVLYDAKSLIYTGGGLSALYLADFAIGKLFGVRPATAIVLATYDVYRTGAKYLSDQVRDSYTNHELNMKEAIQKNRKTVEEQLKNAYLGIADELTRRHKAGSLSKDDLDALKTHFPLIKKALLQIGLTLPVATEILTPLEQAANLISLEQNQPKS